jgi:hypothetical protein
MAAQLKEGRGKGPKESGMQYLRSKMILVRSLSCGTLLLLALLAAPSTRSYATDWAPFVSKTETLKFIAPVACDAWLGWTPPARFLKAYEVAPAPGNPGSFKAFYYPDQEMKLSQFHLRAHWSSGRLLELTAENKRNDPCAVFAELPTKDGVRPFYVPPLAEKQAEWEAAFAGALIKLCFILVVLVPGVLLCSYGFERIESYGIAIGWAVFIAIGAVVVMCANIPYPWSLYERALSYENFFQALPRADHVLLPISEPQFRFLQAGPPHPDQLLMSSEPLWLAVAAAMLWLLIFLPAICRGVYWLLTPLPLEALHRRALREGRAPTPEELTAAVLKACVGKAAWQHRIMQRKADAFAKNLNGIIRHL